MRVKIKCGTLYVDPNEIFHRWKMNKKSHAMRSRRHKKAVPALIFDANANANTRFHTGECVKWVMGENILKCHIVF